ncbi:alpha/beta fold hydrolase [Methanosphaera sp.]|uniref:alpha/beta hydrolase family protein n=1 Tax=Methanosphaera sp. TaxID=2666342 RepID=UPI0025D5EDB0|nr:alpha/beta fold hydrolase [Methanosphaera sp.]
MMDLKKMKEKMNKMPKIGEEGHWSNMKFNENILQDALIKHALGLVYYQMSDVGEIFEIVSQINDKKSEWTPAWANKAEQLKEKAIQYEENNKTVSAYNAYLRSSTYYRIAAMDISNPEDSHMIEYTQEGFNAYEKYLELSDYPGEYIEIPYEDTYLPAHFYKSPTATENAPLFIITPGRDTWAEDTRWIYDAALKRGIHCLVYDGPGQGFALRLNNITFRPDIENVITPLIDYVLEKYDCIDKDKIMAMGMSFGGFLITRAAAYDKRIKLCINDPGNISWGTGIIPRLELIMKIPEKMRPSQLDFMLKDYMWKHGVSEQQLVNELKKYDNTELLDELTCKVLVLDGSSEINKGEARKYYDLLKCPKDYILFDEDSGSQLHTQMGGYANASETILNWIEENV